MQFNVTDLSFLTDNLEDSGELSFFLLEVKYGGVCFEKLSTCLF